MSPVAADRASADSAPGAAAAGEAAADVELVEGAEELVEAPVAGDADAWLEGEEPQPGATAHNASTTAAVES